MTGSKKSIPPFKKLKKKKSAQCHMPIIIPSESLQTFTNQVSEHQHIQPPPPPQYVQPEPQPSALAAPPSKHLSTQSQLSHPSRHQPKSQSKKSQPLPKSHPQPQSKKSQPLLKSQPQHQSTQSQLHPLTQPQPKPPLEPKSQSRPQPHSTQSQPQPPLQSQPPPQFARSQPTPSQAINMPQYRVINAGQSSSSSHISGVNAGDRIPILPEGDGFDRHKLVISQIASIIRSKLEEGKPSWKKLSKNQRDDFFRLFEAKFSWPPECKDMVMRNFNKRASSKMIQLMQEARKNSNERPSWMGDDVWGQLKAHWGSATFKKKSSINRRNRESMDGASLHTGGSIPHRLHWKRMKEEKGTDPSLTDFFFRTHRKKDKTWVGVHAEAAYEKFEQKKNELSSQNSALALGEDEADSQPTIDMPSDLDIWVGAFGNKNGRIFGLGSLTKALIPTSKTTNNFEDVDALRSQIHALNESLQKQEEEKLQMKREFDEKLTETNRKVTQLMEHLGFAASSSRPPPPPQHNEDEDDGDEDEDEDENEKEDEHEGFSDHIN